MYMRKPNNRILPIPSLQGVFMYSPTSRGVGALSLPLSLGIVAPAISHTKAGGQEGWMFTWCLVANDSPIQGRQVHLSKDHVLVVSPESALIHLSVPLVSIQYRSCRRPILISWGSGFELWVIQPLQPMWQHPSESYGHPMILLQGL